MSRLVYVDEACPLCGDHSVTVVERSDWDGGDLYHCRCCDQTWTDVILAAMPDADVIELPT